MTESPDQTTSLCPHCLRRIPARRITENGAVYLAKSCPEHGDLKKVLLWNNFPKPYHAWTRCVPPAPAESTECPRNCGLCPDHKQKTCTAIIEITGQCNLSCPVCFAATGTESRPAPDRSQITRMLEMVRDSAGLCPIQISGGEPTVRNDLPEIIALAQSMGFDLIQINTNGIRLAQDEAYGRALVDAGATVMYLQFDGVTDSVYEQIRGVNLLPLKLKAIENCARWKVGVILVPTVVKHVNDDQIGTIIQFAKKWIPTVKGVHFQPMTYLGRYPVAPRNEDRILLSDILAAIEDQTQGELKVENLLPSG
jgi:7,8-dihydro-6-hydroxymethylpterin dimethyltransferase